VSEGFGRNAAPRLLLEPVVANGGRRPRNRLNSGKTRVAAVLDPQAIESAVRAEYQRLVQSIEGGQDEWKNVIPGKQLLSRFASLTNLDAARLKRLYLQEAAAPRTLSPFEDIVRIFDSFDRA
jgi:hypothetical protein